MTNYSEIKRKRSAMQYHDFYSTDRNGNERTLRAYYHEQPAVADTIDVQGLDTQIDIYKVFFHGRNIVRLLRQETIISWEEEIKNLVNQY